MEIPEPKYMIIANDGQGNTRIFCKGFSDLAVAIEYANERQDKWEEEMVVVPYY
jgi:hypothetical protein